MTARASSPPDHDLVERRELLDAAGMRRALQRMAHEIVEQTAAARGQEQGGPPPPTEQRGPAERLLLVGIRSGGVPLAERLARAIAEIEPPEPELGAIDITLYRDDVFEGLPKPEVGPTELPLSSLAGRTVILVDDVLFTGRTIRAALDALMDYGRPRRVALAVLVDRGHRELPIAADFVGLTVQTTRSESVKVTLSELGGVDRVILRERRS